MSFTEKLFKFALLFFTTCPGMLNTHSLSVFKIILTVLVSIAQKQFLARY